MKLKEMKLKDILTTETWELYGDMDVCNDVLDGYFPAWCGNTFTEEGLNHFKEALDLDATICDYGDYAEIYIRIDDPDEKTWKHNFKIARALFSDMCGYCTEEEYDRWFIDN